VESIVNIISLVLMVLGLTFVVIAQTMKTTSHPPLAKFNVLHWRKPVWLMKDWFTPRGFKFHIAGWSIFDIGVIVQVVQFIC